MGVATTTETGSFGISGFTQGVGNFVAGTTYYFRAYATNPNGTGYGTILSFPAGTDTSVARKMRLFEGYTIKFISGNIVLHRSGGGLPVASDPPTVLTSGATNINQTCATLNANITATGGANATDRGFAYGTDSTLATVIATTTDPGSWGTGTFLHGVVSLINSTLYFFRAYAVNSNGTGYGEILNFFTSGIPCE